MFDMIMRKRKRDNRGKKKGERCTPIEKYFVLALGLGAHLIEKTTFSVSR